MRRSLDFAFDLALGAPEPLGWMEAMEMGGVNAAGFASLPSSVAELVCFSSGVKSDGGKSTGRWATWRAAKVALIFSTGRWASVIDPLEQSSTARSITFRSSRIFPGQP